MSEMKKTPYIWLISGCSSGFGREIALHALSAGDFVGVSSRNIKDVLLPMYPAPPVIKTFISLCYLFDTTDAPSLYLSLIHI